MKILFWDIDGTLMTTAKAGLFAFQQAVTEILAVEVDFKQITTAGMTDCHIARQIISLAKGYDPAPQEINVLVKRYEEVLPAHLATRQGRLAPSVLEILQYFETRNDYMSLLLTGNTHAGARAKLTHYGIFDYFDFNKSMFADNCPDRLDLATNALAKIHKYYPGVSPNDIFVIGDTPNDIRCGKHIQAKTIAVATGRYELPELISYSPWWAIHRLPSPEEFERKIKEV